jgi:sulfite exporter TauE/SafE
MLAGSAPAGAAVMLAFGLGTLPMLLALGAAGVRLRHALQRRAVRVAGGLLVLGFGAAGLARAAGGIQGGWLDMLCLTGSVP